MDIAEKQKVLKPPITIWGIGGKEKHYSRKTHSYQTTFGRLAARVINKNKNTNAVAAKHHLGARRRGFKNINIKRKRKLERQPNNHHTYEQSYIYMYYYFYALII